MAPSTAINLHPRDQLISNLRNNSDINDAEIDKFQNTLVVLEYFRRPNHCGGIMWPEGPGPERRVLSNGQTITWKDVPIDNVLKELDGFVRGRVAVDQRSVVWDRLFEGAETLKRTASWDVPPENPNGDPATRYSASTSMLPKSNSELVKALVKHADLDPKEESFIAGNITLQDASAGKTSASAYFNHEGMKVLGGHLGRDHTLDDVPHHFVRDQIMDYIQTELPEEVQAKVAKTLFEDLSDSELQYYDEAIRAPREADELAQQRRAEKLTEIINQRGQSLKNPGEAKNMLYLEEAIDAIISDQVDITAVPEVDHAERDFERVPPIFGSCIEPDKPATKAEDAIVDDLGPIHHNCDQVRAMFARLIRYSDDWTDQSFRKALGRIERGKLMQFLERRGPEAGRQLGVFQLCSEFFRRRELMGVPLPAPPEEETSSSKRKRGPLEEREANVIEFTSNDRTAKNKARRLS